MSFTKAIQGLINTCCTRANGVAAAKSIGELALLAVPVIGILGLLQTSGHLNLPHSFDWLSKTIDTIKYKEAFGAMIGGFMLIRLGIVFGPELKARYDERKASTM
ncbi:MAG: hypothetical protein JSS62_03925 [Verrucomicrobia bacterium]|nr:hypothetical protein [Verrucomicrobiota bacterium]MBS0647081.1 hypothetical protein [Verrucomicrobiota bacterium]